MIELLPELVQVDFLKLVSYSLLRLLYVFDVFNALLELVAIPSTHTFSSANCVHHALTFDRHG